MLVTAHEQLEKWHDELDEPLDWTRRNMLVGAPGFFLLQLVVMPLSHHVKVRSN